jgi:translocation and assembly module TamA
MICAARAISVGRLLRLVLAIGLALSLAEARAADDGGIRYKARIEGVPDAGLRELLKQVSGLMTRGDQRPPSRSALERRAAEDEQDLRKVLESEGYYDSNIHVRLDDEKDPLEAVIVIDLGQRFTLAAFDIRFASDVNAPPRALLTQEAVLPPPGSPARSADILAAQTRMLELLRASSYPLAKVTQEVYEVDRAAMTMTVHWTVDHGGPWRFGALVIENAKGVDHGYIRRKVPWTEGEPFDMALFPEYRRSLEETALFNGIAITPDEEHPGADGRLPVKLGLQERPHRSIALGATYSTNEGPGLQISWQNRNLFQRARNLNLALTIATIRQSLDATYRSPEFKRSDQTLVLGATIKNEDNDAYQEKSATASAGIERQFSKALKISASVAPEYSIIDDSQGKRTTELLNFPVIATYDTSDDYLDPTRGVRARLTVSPSIGYSEGPISFFTIEGLAATYLKLMEKPRLILGLRTRLGFIAGEDTDDIPANHRFYAGGGGSIRGYGYKKVGPLDANNDPTGGRTVNEFGAELRIRVTNSIGIVPFIEAGNVYDGAFDSIGTDLRLGAGLGLRYYTAIGPLRLDVGVPLDRRRDVDDAVQIYVSIGQAF